MKRWILLTAGITFLWPALWASAAEARNLLVVTGDQKLVLIHPDGSQELISADAGGGTFSPDGQAVAFVVSHTWGDPAQGTFNFESKLVVVNLATRATTEVVHLSAGAGIGQVEWAPDGNAIAYEVTVRGKSDDLFLAPFPPDGRPARNLGHWYQGFSFSPDGRRIVHAVNYPVPGLEVLDIAGGTRRLLHKATNVVWQAQFSPDGKFIAYTQTVEEPQQSSRETDDDEPDCSAPDRELRLYSLADGSDTPIALHQRSLAGSVHDFVWSPDSKRIALEVGSEDCSSPSFDAQVFVTTVDQTSQAQISAAAPALEPAFSPDGSAITFVDFSQFPNRLLRYELASGTRALVRQAAAQENTYDLLGWN